LLFRPIILGILDLRQTIRASQRLELSVVEDPRVGLIEPPVGLLDLRIALIETPIALLEPLITLLDPGIDPLAILIQPHDPTVVLHIVVPGKLVEFGVALRERRIPVRLLPGQILSPHRVQSDLPIEIPLLDIEPPPGIL
jgi:hypothetical protein